ncbi:hypothetical protein [Nitrosospira multiformis]|nr:hypothetical protein [Nitrosospira multiformis]SDZ89584.1 hypothetical protein SAMN05216411_102322 [Nitrosospira multiformis]SEG08224.1 hypothetical protein SAMN05216403_1287 [Nitrosospira multiformis ATCC 25196]
MTIQDVSLYLEKEYPESVREMISQFGDNGSRLANRWMILRPERVRSLLETGQYERLFWVQMEKERQAVAQAAQQGMILSQTDAALWAGLSLDPPELECVLNQ